MEKDSYTNQILHLEVNEHHTLYVQDWGNPAAKTPIISLHGGPGGQAKDSHKSVFNPELQRVIFFDQRGCGQSLPYGSLEDNTTDELLNDISVIADTLDIKKFALQGRSWGSCLALMYAISNPERVVGMALGGIFTGSAEEISWVDQGLFQTFYPEIWQQYKAETPTKHQDNPSNYHFSKVLHGTNQEKKKSAFAYQNLEGGVVKLDDRPFITNIKDFDPASTIIEIHYIANRCFIPDNYILDHAEKLTMPIVLIQGRYDMVCPPKTAFKLHDKLPNSELITTLSGHISEHEDVQLMKQALLHLTT